VSTAPVTRDAKPRIIDQKQRERVRPRRRDLNRLCQRTVHRHDRRTTVVRRRKVVDRPYDELPYTHRP